MTEREALKLALEALEYPLNQSHENFNVDMAELISHRAITTIKEALAQPYQFRDATEMMAQQEPVAWMWVVDGKPKTVSFGGANSNTPKEWVVLPLYTTPPQRTWVGLTDEDLRELGFKTRPRWWPALEAKLKEKNT